MNTVFIAFGLMIALYLLFWLLDQIVAQFNQSYNGAAEGDGWIKIVFSFAIFVGIGALYFYAHANVDALTNSDNTFLQWLGSTLHNFSVVDFSLSIVAIASLNAWRASASKLESTETELDQYRTKLSKLKNEHQVELKKIKKELYEELQMARTEQEKLIKLVEQKRWSDADSMVSRIGEWIDRGFQALEFVSQITTEEDA